MFDGLKFENANAVSASLGDNYYLSLRLDFNDENKILCENEGFVNNALIIVNTLDLTCEIVRGVDIKSLLPIKTDIPVQPSAPITTSTVKMDEESDDDFDDFFDFFDDI